MREEGGKTARVPEKNLLCVWRAEGAGRGGGGGAETMKTHGSSFRGDGRKMSKRNTPSYIDMRQDKDVRGETRTLY